MSEPQVEPSSGPGALRSLIVAALVILVVLATLAGIRSYRDLAVARQREAELEQRLSEARRHIEELSRTIQRLREDPEALERLAREDLGLVRPGDVVVVLPEEPEPPSPPPSTEVSRPPAPALSPP